MNKQKKTFKKLAPVSPKITDLTKLTCRSKKLAAPEAPPRGNPKGPPGELELYWGCTAQGEPDLGSRPVVHTFQRPRAGAY